MTRDNIAWCNNVSQWHYCNNNIGGKAWWIPVDSQCTERVHLLFLVKLLCNSGSQICSCCLNITTLGKWYNRGNWGRMYSWLSGLIEGEGMHRELRNMNNPNLVFYTLTHSLCAHMYTSGDELHMDVSTFMNHLFYIYIKQIIHTCIIKSTLYIVYYS